MAKRDVVFPKGRQALYEQNAYSAAVRTGDFYSCRARLAAVKTAPPEPDFAAQVQLAFDNLQRVLTAAGASFEDIVDVTSFHTDPDTQFETVMAAKARAFPEKPYPNWTAVGVTWLAGFDFEIKVIARLPA